MSEPSVHYRVRVPEPSSHLVVIELTLSDASSLGDTVELSMAAWCPGSYLVRDYARFVQDIRAWQSLHEVEVRATSKNSWSVDLNGDDELKVSYSVYGYELSVRTNHIDDSHAFLHAPATFIYVPALRDRACTVEIDVPHEDWTLATGLKTVGDHHIARDVDELFDCPIHVGVSKTIAFEGAGKPCRLTVWGEPSPSAQFSLEDLATDVEAIVEEHARRFGGVPYDDYTFILMLSPKAYGGLEHRNSSANLHSPFAFDSSQNYQDLLELLSHEFFHVWNGVRIRPEAFVTFDYDRENYTRCLWVMEGLTSYYDRLTVRHADKLSTKRYLIKLAEEWGRLQGQPGRSRHSLEASSFQAWVKLYKPHMNNINTTVSYYLKGGLVCTALDLLVRRTTGLERSLDTVMTVLWQRYGGEGVGYPEDLTSLFSEAVGFDLSEFFDRYIRGTEDPDLSGELSHAGLALSGEWDGHDDGRPIPMQLGVVLSGGRRVSSVIEGTPASAAGLSPGDELIAIDRYRIGGEGDLRKRLAGRDEGETARIACFRRGRLIEIDVVLAKSPPNRYEITAVDEPTKEQKSLFEAWLGEPFPETKILAKAKVARWL